MTAPTGLTGSTTNPVARGEAAAERTTRGERRAVPRRSTPHRVTAIPVLPDGFPDWERRASGAARDLSPGGIGLELDSPADMPAGSPVLLVLQDSPPGGPLCAGVEVRHTRRLGPGRLRVGSSFGGLAGEVVRPENLVPRFRPESMALVPGWPEPVLRKWADLGVLRADVVDRIQLCPACHGLPTFRRGCSGCGSARVTADRFIHHFTCAHVGPVGDFEAGEELVCPKCRTRRLVVGADYEYLTGVHHCADCHWGDAQLGPVAQCLRCGLRFPGDQAVEWELTGYHAHHLDPLALLAGAG